MATKRLYVGNIPYTATDSSLREAFSAYGASEVRIIEGRGFAFVDIDGDQIEAAVAEMGGKQFEGRTLNVNEAKPRENSGGGGGRGDGGGRSNSSGGSTRGGRW